MLSSGSGQSSAISSGSSIKKVETSLRNAALLTALSPTLLNELIDVVDRYDQTSFTPVAVYKIREKNEYLVLSIPSGDESNCTDVGKRISAHIISPPNGVRALKIADICSGRNTFQEADYFFESDDQNTYQIRTERTLKFADLLNIGVNADVFHQLNIVFKFTNLHNGSADQCYITFPAPKPQPDKTPQEKLETAVAEDDVEAIQKLIKKEGLSPDLLDGHGNPMLIVAIIKRSVNALKKLVELGANIEARGSDNVKFGTALLYAVSLYAQLLGAHEQSLKEIIEYLVSKKANVNARDIKGKTCLHHLAWTILGESCEMVKYFLDHGADPTLTDLSDARPTDPVIGKSKGLAYLYAHVMHTDAEKRVESWSYQQGKFHIRFKPGLSSNDCVWAFQAIVNKLKTQDVNHELGLLKDDAKCVIKVARTIEHQSQLPVPDRYFHAIENVHADKNEMVITLKEAYVDNFLVINKLKSIFAELNLKQSVLADEKVSDKPAALFNGKDANKKDEPKGMLTFSQLKNL